MDQIVAQSPDATDHARQDAFDTRVRHFRESLLWPVRLAEHGGGVRGLVASLLKPGSPWKIHNDEFDDPVEFRERHYHELVTFLPPVRRFLYGEGAGAGATGSIATEVLRRTDVARVRVTLAGATTAVTLDVAHVDLYIFADVDLAMLNLEVTADNVPLRTAQDVMYQFGRLYPCKWADDGAPADCPARVEWLSDDGRVLAVSDYEERAKYLKFVCLNRTPLVASHWEFLIRPLTQFVSGARDDQQYKLLEGDRLPLMAFVGTLNSNSLTRGDYVRLAFAGASGDSTCLPFAERHLEHFEADYCYDRHDERRGGGEPITLRFMSSETAFVVAGRWEDEGFACPERGYLGQFRHQQFLLFMIAHFQKAALLMFSDRLAGAVKELDISDPKAILAFRGALRLELERFLRFTHRYWFYSVSSNELDRELFALSRRHLGLDRLFEDVRAEIEEMSQFLETEALRRQNDSMMRLTVVTIFGLIWTIVTGFLGMNIFDYTALSPLQKTGAFLVVLAPTIALMMIAVRSSRRLSAYLDRLSDGLSNGKLKGRRRT
ncbi:MAG: CorA family divalent cation transporter [Hyphomicrobium sp.]